jgi:hypothetical protein
MRSLLQNWPMPRILRLAFAVVFLAAGLSRGDTLAYFIAAVFGIQAVFNIGCCGATCAPSTATSQASDVAVSAIKDVTFEEVK